jgi:hypothetical protein
MARYAARKERKMNLVITKYLGVALILAGIAAGVLAGLGKDATKAWEAFGLIGAGLIGVVRQEHPTGKPQKQEEKNDEPI